MGRIIKLAILSSVLLVVLIVVFGLYVAVVAGVDIPGLTGAFRAQGEPISPEAIARGRAVEQKINDAVEDKSAFFLELTDAELTDLLLSKIDPDAQIRDAEVSITPDNEVKLSGSLNGRIAIGFSGTVGVSLEAGEIELDVRGISIGFIPLPGAAGDQVEPLVNDVLDINRSLRQAGATQIQRLLTEQGRITIVGVQQAGETVSQLTKDTFLSAVAAAGDRVAPTPPGADLVPPGRTGGEDRPELYLALGDSLAANVGVGVPMEGYVSRFHGYLERTTGRSLGLLNLGISGESTISILMDQLPRALNEIAARRDDGDPSTTVSFLSMDLGGNDLLAHLGSDDCQIPARTQACQTRADAALQSFEGNFDQIVSSLAGALEPGADFYIMTAYNPFSFGLGLPTESFTDEVVERLNVIIRETAAAHGARVGDPYDLMRGKVASWTNMLFGDIHPNANGYQALAYSLTQAR